MSNSAAAVALAFAAGAAAAPLRVVGVPERALSRRWREAGIARQQMRLPRLLASIRAIGPLGEAVLGGVEAAALDDLAVVWLVGRKLPRAVRGAFPDLGPQAWRQLLAGNPTARWASDGRRGLILIRLDLLRRERQRAGTATCAGLVAHELTHVAQWTWGRLGRRADGGWTAHDFEDEVEAELVARLVDRDRARAAGLPETRGAPLRALLALSPPGSARDLDAVRASMRREGAYPNLPAGPLDDPERKVEVPPSFRRLRGPGAPGGGLGRAGGRSFEEASRPDRR